MKNTRVGHLQGLEQLDDYTKDFRHVWKAETFRELFEMLAAGKLDAVVSEEMASKIEIEALELDNIVALEKSMTPVYPFHFLHEKHADLVPKITEVLREMKTNGEMNQIVGSHSKTTVISRASDRRTSC